MDRKEIQTRRMWQYFINATTDLIDEEGIENLTARKIADKAGYTVSTIYNYFDELSHLIFFASMRQVREYTEDLPRYIKRGKNYLEKYLHTWECFCHHSFQKPQIYYSIFITDLGVKPDELFQHYYSIYHEDLLEIPDEIKPLILEQDLTTRNKGLLEMAYREGSIKSDEIDDITEMSVLIWTAMLTRLLNKRKSYTAEEATKTTMAYIRKITGLEKLEGN
ncbi:TetR/AcrR family transcriptional regulator [Cytobacillus sp. NJ13]|nr:TetR/AcrR family transcriptional regulator [Cytobacillus sp. NJ13]